MSDFKEGRIGSDLCFRAVILIAMQKMDERRDGKTGSQGHGQVTA